MKKWIPCRVFPGMFSDERTIEIGDQSFFVDEKTIRNEHAGLAEIEVEIVRVDGQKWAVLPTSTKETVLLEA